MNPTLWIRPLRDVSLDDVGSVGGKNASLGELLRELEPLGVAVPDGFAVTADAYRRYLATAGLDRAIADELRGLDKHDVDDLVGRADRIRDRFVAAPLPDEIASAVRSAYEALAKASFDERLSVAVRSSATAEDLPGASFAGQQETYLHVQGADAVLDAVRRAFASLFTARAISYREDMGFDHARVALSVGVQAMVRSDLASAGVIFTLDPDTGHRGVVLVTSSYGLGESVVQGRVAPDELLVHKATLREGFRSIVARTLGPKEERLVYDDRPDHPVRREPVPLAERARWSIGDDDVLTLARWALAIEEHYSRKRGVETPMDIEWAKDGITGRLFVVQARPETVHAKRGRPTLRRFRLGPHGEARLSGLAVGEGVAHGKVRVVADLRAIGAVRAGDVLVTESTDPDWEPIMKTASAIVTERGGRTSHAAIIARELGIPALVAAADATTKLTDGAPVTVSCAEGGEVGHVYDGDVPFEVETIAADDVPRTRTRLFLNVADPDRALALSLLPSAGVGLARMEFVLASAVGVHPLALTRYASLSPADRAAVDAVTAGYTDKPRYFVDRLAQGIATIAAAFHPRPVILRFSDFKSNEYARLVGGASFEPTEENPMLGFRGASRYYHPAYHDGFLLECAAVRRVREVFGLTNLKLMVPFCRTPEEGRKVLDVMARAGLVRGERGLEVYVMAEVPSNILLADRFAALFDGFSIGSNDLTQLTLGIDRDSALVAPLFDERNEAVQLSCERLIRAAQRAGRTVGICGAAPSDHPELAARLVEAGIDSLSLAPDALLATATRVAATEAELARKATGVRPVATAE